MAKPTSFAASGDWSAGHDARLSAAARGHRERGRSVDAYSDYASATTTFTSWIARCGLRAKTGAAIATRVTRGFSTHPGAASALTEPSGNAC